jgi:4-aminobutyrate aminotransferase
METLETTRTGDVHQAPGPVPPPAVPPEHALDVMPASDHGPDEPERRDHLSPVLGRYFQFEWSHGEGHRLYDVDGRAFLDFATGIASTILGHGHPGVNAAIHAQVDRLIHTSNATGYIGSVRELADAIASVMPDPLDTVFFGNSGAEAIEGAIKLARRVTGRPGIVGFTGSFHGRTMGAVALTSSSLNYRTGYEPLLPGVYLSPFPNVYRDWGGNEEAATQGALAHLDWLLATVVPPSAVAAFVIEPVQGEGGYNPAPLRFLQGLRELADRHGILLIADEVQTGYGRTGRMWGFERAGIVPDVVCLAKGIANGLPLGAIVSRRELQERWGVGAHGSTFGGNPVACAAGVAVLRAIRAGDLVANAAARGEQLSAGLRRLAEQHDAIGDVRGPGLMIGVEFVKDRASREPDGDRADAVIARSAELGLLLLTCGVAHQVVRWLAPVSVSAEEVDEALAIFARALDDTAGASATS